MSGIDPILYEQIKGLFLPTLTFVSAIGCAYLASKSIKKTSELKIEVNHRMDQLLYISKEQARSEGVKEGEANINRDRPDTGDTR